MFIWLAVCWKPTHSQWNSVIKKKKILENAKKPSNGFYNKPSWNFYIYVKERIIFLDQREIAEYMYMFYKIFIVQCIFF